jgi:hypothetical protein
MEHRIETKATAKLLEEIKKDFSKKDPTNRSLADLINVEENVDKEEATTSEK